MITGNGARILVLIALSFLVVGGCKKEPEPTEEMLYTVSNKGYLVRLDMVAESFDSVLAVHYRGCENQVEATLPTSTILIDY